MTLREGRAGGIVQEAEPVGAPARRSGIARSIRLLNAFRHEASDPEQFGRVMAEDTVEILGEFADLTGAVVVDVGGASGYVAEALCRSGARAFTVEYDPVEMNLGDHDFSGGVRADGRYLPFADDSLDLCYSSNVIEHVPGPVLMLEEMVRIVRPGGKIVVAYTNWLSPWGGHETSPWHFLGGERAVRLYRRRYGHEPKNRYGTSLFPLHLRDLLRWAKGNPQVKVLASFPRYYPRWCSGLVRVAGIREVVTWNFAMVLQKGPDPDPAAA